MLDNHPCFAQSIIFLLGAWIRSDYNVWILSKRRDNLLIWYQRRSTLTKPSHDQCSRLKPSHGFHLEGLSNFGFSDEGLFQIQDINPRIQEWSTKPILKLCMNYMVHVSNTTMWRNKIQPSNSTFCSDNALRLLILVAVCQDSKMPFQSMDSTPNTFGLTLVKASSVSRLSHLSFEKPMLIGS